MGKPVTVKIITQDDLIKAGCFSVQEIMEVIESALIEYKKGNVIFPEKIATIFDNKTQNRINCLPAAIVKEKIYGMKWISVFPSNSHTEYQNQTAVIVLSELENGYPIAFMDGILESHMRTSCIGALAAKYLAKKNSKTIGFIGAGELAKAHLIAMKDVFPDLKECRVASRTLETEGRFIEEMTNWYPGMQIIGCKGNYRNAIIDSDIIITAISGQEPILKADWIKDGAFYCHVAGLEDEFLVAKKASKIVVDDWSVVKHRTQTISQMYKKGILKDSDIYANLVDILLGEKKGRENDTEFIYFNSVGLSFIDVAVANWMYKRICENKLGLDVCIQEKSIFKYYK